VYYTSVLQAGGHGFSSFSRHFFTLLYVRKRLWFFATMSVGPKLQGFSPPSKRIDKALLF
jgi:hypothetical protein